MILSIITITLNNPDELERTIQSVPDYDFIEHVIVNGGDPVDEIIKKHNPDAFLINEKDSGISDAFNKGTIRSSGDFLMYLNSGDTILKPEYLFNAFNLLIENNEIAFVHSNILFADKYGGELPVKPGMKNEGRGMKYLHPAMIIRREVYNSVKGFDTSYKIAMDFDFILRAEMKGYKGFYMNTEPVVRMEGGGKSQSNEFISIKECFRSLKENKMLSLENAAGLSTRFIFFLLRKVMIISGGGNLLGKMKRIKYSGKD